MTDSSSDTVADARARTHPEGPVATAPTLASAIRKRRKAAGMTQAELARAAQLSTSFISQLERSNSDVTVSTLNRICAALGTTVGHLFMAPRLAGRVTRKDAYKRLDYNGITKFVLSRESMVDVDVCLFEFPPGSSTGLRTPPGHPRSELWICQSEYLGIDLDDDVHILRAGDSIDFPSDRPSEVYNPGPQTAVALLIIKNHHRTGSAS